MVRDDTVGQSSLVLKVSSFDSEKSIFQFLCSTSVEGVHR